MTTRTKPWQMLKAERVKLQKLFTAWLTEHEAKPTRKGWEHMYPWEVETTLGPYVLNFSVDYGTIFGRFLDVDKARLHVPCNPYSGKYNSHFGRATATEAFIQFSHAVNRFMPAER